MIVPEGYDVEARDPERWAGFQAGGIMVPVTGDDVRTLWGASWPGVADVMALLVTSKDGHHWLMGRIRVHASAAPPGSAEASADVKHVSQVCFPPEISCCEVAEKVPSIFGVAAFAALGLPPVEFERVEVGGDPEGVPAALERLALLDGSWHHVLTEYEGEP